MSEIRRVSDLEIAQDLDFQRRVWVVQRIGWAVMMLLLVAALLGLLGPGPLSSTSAGDPSSMLWVEYNRFERYEAPSLLHVHIGPGAAQDGRVRLWLNHDLVSNSEIQHIDPEPESVEVWPDRFTYVFAAPDPTRPIVITYHLESEQYGRQAVRLGLDAGPELQFDQFIYP